MTIEQILADLKPVKRISRKTLYLYLNKCGISPVSELRQRPQQYPEDAPLIIRVKLGLPKTNPPRRGRNNTVKAIQQFLKSGGSR